jgi:YD repeat-containing protein
MKESATPQNRHYTYFNSGDINTVTDNLTGVTCYYTYDDLHRLTDETNTGGFGVMHVAYDAIGNITQKTVGPNTFTLCYDASHRHAVDYVRYNSTNYDYTYDANGNMSHREIASNLLGE